MKLALLTSLVAGFVVAIWLKGTFGHGLWNAQGLIFILLPLIVIWLPCASVEFIKIKRVSKFTKILGLVTLCWGTFLICSEVLGYGVYRFHNWRAEQFGEQLLSKIEKFEAENGKLPEDISQVEKRIPPYPMGTWCYSPDGEDFLVSYPDMRDIKGAPISLSRDREWISFYDRARPSDEREPK